MANTRNSNSWYIDTQYSSATDDLSLNQLQVFAIFVTATAANGQVVLGDPVTGAKKLDLRVPTANQTQMFTFYETPISFPNGIRVLTLANAVATAVGSSNGV